MNYLIIILIVFVFLKNKNGSNNFLGGINFNDVSPILNLLIESNILNNLNFSSIENLLNGKFNFQELLPLVTSFISGFNVAPTSATNFNNESDGLEPIKDLFDGEFYSALENYFEN